MDSKTLMEFFLKKCVEMVTWTKDGAYTSKSVHLAQFSGTFSSFNGPSILKAHAEGKHKFTPFGTVKVI
jgi:hypothetical protein